MPDAVIPLRQAGFAAAIAGSVREARRLVGWTQRELATAATTSQATVCRLERGRATAVDVLLVERVLDALGMRASLHLDGRHLDDRRRQVDALHALVNGYAARRVERDGWLPATEVQLGDTAPRGWIDLLAFRSVDRSLLVEETKTDIPDIGGLQRSLSFYEREALAAAKRLGWHPKRVAVLVVALDTEVVHRRLADARDLVVRAFPAKVEATGAWLRDPDMPAPRGWTLATCDPAARGGNWLRPTLLGSRRRPPSYAGYADAAARLLRGPGSRRPR
jgi:transcriptional regulator with XRE-family HTH domain